MDEVAAEALQKGEERARAAEAERLRAKSAAARPGGWRSTPRRRRPPRAWTSPPGSSAGWPSAPVAFVIGGAVGIAADLLAECDERMSLGPLTMPHQLARVVLGEQLYRALCITSGHPYPH